MGGAESPRAARAVLRNSAVLAVGKVLERATGFVVALLVASKLGVDGLGVYAVAWGIYGFMSIAGEAGTSNYLVREISRDRSRTAGYTVHLGILALAATAALTLVAQVIVRHLGYSAELEASVFVVLFAVPPATLNGLQEAVFVAHGRVQFETATRMFTSGAYVLAAAWLLAHGYGVPALLAALVATECVVTVVYLVLTTRFIVRLRLRFRWSLAVRLVREIKTYTASSTIAAFFSRPEILIMSVMASERQIGLYSAAVRIAELPLLVPEVFMINVFPLLSEAFGTDEDRFAAWQRTAVRAVLAFSLPLAVVFIVGPDPIIRLLFGTEFEDAAPVLSILAIGAVAASLNAIFYRSLVARGRQGTNVAIQAASVVIRLGAGVLLIAPLAAIGAAIANVVSTAVHTVLLAGATGRSGAPVRLLRVGWRFMVAAGLAGLAAWLTEDLLPSLASLVLGTLLYVLASLAIGAVTPGDRRMLQRLRASRAANPP